MIQPIVLLNGSVFRKTLENDWEGMQINADGNEHGF
jgi:hypothetical protein